MPPSDLRDAARLATDAAEGVADLVESSHAVIARPWRRSGRAGGLSGVVYRTVRRGIRGVGRALDVALAAADGTAEERSPRTEAVVAALNGVYGDALAARDRALATTLHLRHGGGPLTPAPDAVRRSVAAPSETVLVLVHGVCMHDGQWAGEAHDQGAALADALGATLLAVRYNSGRHVSDNGRDLDAALDALVTAWPRPVRRLVIVGHSMGGLVARSALDQAACGGWAALDVSVVTLGTPHHGAPLERLGNLLDAALGSTRWTAPFARIGQVRSAGVTDLRYGSVRREDWAGRDRFRRGPDARHPAPVPDGVALYVVAATTGDGSGGLRDQTVGDGLVPVDSALGRHPDAARDLAVPIGRQWVAVGMGHFDLTRRPEVTDRLVAWLAPRAS